MATSDDDLGRTRSGGTRVLFVCLGNICRSPMAEAVFQHKLLGSNHPSNFHVSRIDSAGTGAYHEKSPPDQRTMEVLRRHGIRSYMHAARKVKSADFTRFDYILGMDFENVEDLQELRQKVAQKKKSEDGLAKVLLFGQFGGLSEQEEVVDPYYGDNNGFDIAFEQMERFSAGFLKHLEGQLVKQESHDEQSKS